MKSTNSMRSQRPFWRGGSQAKHDETLQWIPRENVPVNKTLTTITFLCPWWNGCNSMWSPTTRLGDLGAFGFSFGTGVQIWVLKLTLIQNSRLNVSSLWYYYFSRMYWGPISLPHSLFQFSRKWLHRLQNRWTAKNLRGRCSLEISDMFDNCISPMVLPK